MRTLSKWAVLVALAGSTLWGSACMTSVRDAVVGGAMDFVAGNTTNILGQLLPVSGDATEKQAP